MSDVSTPTTLTGSVGPSVSIGTALLTTTSSLISAPPGVVVPPRSAMADFVLPQSFADGAVRRVPSAAPLGKPKKSEFISPHPDVGVRRRVGVIDDDDSFGDIYVLAPALIPEFADLCRPVDLVPYLTRDGDVRLWPIGLPDANGRTYSWHASARRIADDYAGGWVRVVSNRATGGYDAVIPCGTLRAPDWSGLDIDAIYDTTLATFGIRGVDHPLLARLRGAV